MPFPVGAHVVVSTLGKKGRVVEATAAGRYRVVVGPMTVWCEEADLASVSQEKHGAGRGKGRAAESRNGGWSLSGGDQAVAGDRQREALRSLDLHGMTVEEALRAVQLRLDLAIRAGLDRVEIIHGISGGRLRAAVRGYLAGIGSISRFEPDPHNAGATLVYL